MEEVGGLVVLEEEIQIEVGLAVPQIEEVLGEILVKATLQEDSAVLKVEEVLGEEILVKII